VVEGGVRERRDEHVTMARFTSPYTGKYVGRKEHDRQVGRASARVTKWGREIRRREEALERARSRRTIEARRVALAEALRREYHAVEDLAVLREQEQRGLGKQIAEFEFGELSEKYERFEIPLEADQEELFDEVEGVEFEIRAESEGDTGETGA
jgi:hypothetical protein